MEPTEEDISDLRQKALDKIEANGIGLYHSKDVERVKNDRRWLRRFLLHHELDGTKALNMIISTLDWRKKNAVNEISHTSINLQVICSGGMFPKSRDKDGRQLFIIKAKSNVKGQFKSEDIQKCLIYWMERLEKQEKGEKISIFFEMTGAGLSNLDMEFVQYLISLFRDYYPFFLNYIIIFEMAWILNAAWKVIKAWMPGKSADLVKFVGRSDLKDYVPVSEQLSEWGGSVNYHFIFEPEFLPAAGPVTLNGQIDDAKKKVHFAEDTASNDSGSIESADLVKKPLPGQLLLLAPTEEIVFRRDDGETTGLLTMTNTATCAVAYKIKTTSPDKYRVRPSAGVLSAGSVLNITVHIQSGYSAAQLVRDKFLVMACTVDSDTLTNQQLSEVWKKTNEASVQQHRLRCSVAPSDAKDEEFSGMSAGANNATAVKLLQEIGPKLDTIIRDQERLRDQMKQLRFLLLLLLFLAFAAPYYMLRNSSGGYVSDFHDNGACHSVSPASSPSS